MLITPKIIDFHNNDWNRERVESAAQLEQALDRKQEKAKQELQRLMGNDDDAQRSAGHALEDYRALTADM